MTLTAIAGALVALVPAFRPKGDKPKPYVSKDPLIAFTVMLERGIARRDGEIERLERDLAIQRQLADHWQGQARILAQALRREREGGASWAAPRQMACAQAVQQNQQLALQQQYCAQQNGLAFEGLCNCVPSRAQVWGAQAHGLVGQLNGHGE